MWPPLDQARPGDTVVVWRLDRLGRSLRHLIETVAHLEHRSVSFVSLTENIDTSTPGGRLVFHVFGALAEFERDLIRGAHPGRFGGRPGSRPSRWQAHGLDGGQDPDGRERCMPAESTTSPRSPARWASAVRLCTAPYRSASLPEQPQRPLLRLIVGGGASAPFPVSLSPGTRAEPGLRTASCSWSRAEDRSWRDLVLYRAGAMTRM